MMLPVVAIVAAVVWRAGRDQARLAEYEGTAKNEDERAPSPQATLVSMMSGRESVVTASPNTSPNSARERSPLSKGAKESQRRQQERAARESEVVREEDETDIFEDALEDDVECGWGAAGENGGVNHRRGNGPQSGPQSGPQGAADGADDSTGGGGCRGSRRASPKAEAELDAMLDTRFSELRKAVSNTSQLALEDEDEETWSPHNLSISWRARLKDSKAMRSPRGLLSGPPAPCLLTSRSSEGLVEANDVRPDERPAL